MLKVFNIPKLDKTAPAKLMCCLNFKYTVSGKKQPP